MALFALRRLVLAIPLLIGITFVSFLVIQLAPGGPFDYLRTDSTSQDPKLIERLNKEYGLDQPTYVQYWRWLNRIAFSRSSARISARISRCFRMTRSSVRTPRSARSSSR